MRKCKILGIHYRSGLGKQGAEFNLVGRCMRACGQGSREGK